MAKPRNPSNTRSLINVAPALSELAILGKITSHPRKVGPPLPYDCLVVDAFATGHFLALIQAPHGMAEAIRFGPMGDQSRSIERVLKDEEQCSYYIVSFPEELPVVEGMELWDGIRKILGVTPIHLFNRYLDPTKEAEYIQLGLKTEAEMFQYIWEKTSGLPESIKKSTYLVNTPGKVLQGR